LSSTSSETGRSPRSARSMRRARPPSRFSHTDRRPCPTRCTVPETILNPCAWRSSCVEGMDPVGGQRPQALAAGACLGLRLRVAVQVPVVGGDGDPQGQPLSEQLFTEAGLVRQKHMRQAAPIVVLALGPITQQDPMVLGPEQMLQGALGGTGVGLRGLPVAPQLRGVQTDEADLLPVFQSDGVAVIDPHHPRAGVDTVGEAGRCARGGGRGPQQNEKGAPAQGRPWLPSTAW
jgi:hypothetical protein